MRPARIKADHGLVPGQACRAGSYLSTEPAGVSYFKLGTSEQSSMMKDFAADIAAIQRIAAVPRILEVICRSTGMGFAAIARVTDERWVCCALLDDIGFGLKPGGCR